MTRISPDLITGDSGSGKTTLLRTAAKYIYKTTKKKSRVYAADPGGYEPLRSLIDLGIVEVWYLPMTDVKWTLDLIRKATQGYWYNAEKQTIVKPTVGTALNDVGGFFFEGLRAFGERLIAYMADRVAEGGPSIGKAADAPFWLEERDVEAEKDAAKAYRLGGNSPTHYQAVQNELYARVDESSYIPGAVKVIWTSTEQKDLDEKTKMPIYGPALAGKAKTADIPRWFGNYLTIEQRRQQDGSIKRILHTSLWNEQVVGIKIEHLNKTREVSYEGVGWKPIVPAECTCDLGVFYRMLEEALCKATEWEKKDLGLQ